MFSRLCYRIFEGEMTMQQQVRRREATAFEAYLRTGRRTPAAKIEFKFNPWHDPEDGRFTFAGRGNYFPRSGLVSARHRPQDFGGGGGASGSWGNDPSDSQNHVLYAVRRGDTLTRIARQRKGLTAADLAWLNQIPIDRPLRIGQQIKVPNQRFLDAGRDAKNKFLALDYYMRTHGGRLPPDPRNPPSLESQLLDSNWRRESKNGYDYQIDAIGRTRMVYGVLHFGPSKRSRRSQAGVEDRRADDDGGHYIAVRFDGPGDRFNHFAQNANFNRGAYRIIEDGWAADLRAGRRVFVDIKAVYVGTSKRPNRVNVTWYVEGQKRFKSFPNASGKTHARR
jgi:LysM repeat protein